jgi:hypothetical protein
MESEAGMRRDKGNMAPAGPGQHLPRSGTAKARDPDLVSDSRIRLPRCAADNECSAAGADGARRNRPRAYREDKKRFAG